MYIVNISIVCHLRRPRRRTGGASSADDNVKGFNPLCLGDVPGLTQNMRLKLRLYGYTGGCTFACCMRTQNIHEKWFIPPRCQPQLLSYPYP